MGIIEKVTEFLLSKHWLSLFLAIPCSVLTIAKVPADYYDKFPFTDHNVNVAIVFSAIAVAFCLLFLSIQTIGKKIKKKYKGNKDKAWERSYSDMATNEYIEGIRREVDSFSDYHYSIVRFLLDNENKISFKTNSYSQGFSILDDPSKFNKAPYSCPQKDQQEQSKNPLFQYLVSTAGTQYLLTPQYYDVLKFVESKTGNISHFQRTTIDLEQEQYQ